MKYWVSFAAFQVFEFVSDYTLAFIVPFYLELKITCILWLVMGTKLIFDSIVNRELTKREKTIDKWLNRFSKARNEMVALVWFEMSRCSVKIITMLMSVGMSALLIEESSNESKQEDMCNKGKSKKDQDSDTELEEAEDQDDNNNGEDKMDVTETQVQERYLG